jgi:hypothetical protein
MPRLPGRRLVPWFVVFEVLRAGKAHWDELDPRDRTRLVELMRKSKGRASNLDERERTELRMIARRLQLVRFGRNAAAAALMGHRRNRGRG